MKTNELRIGNWVKVNDPIFGVNTYKVATIRDNGIITLNDNMSCLVDNIEPIELTREMLIKIGFKTDKYYSCFEIWHDNTFIRYIERYNLLYLIKLVSEEEGLYSEIKLYGIKYFHQLQNAYYLLTGEKLEGEL